MKLDDTDYESIFLRVREKLFMQLSLFISVVAIGTGFTTWKAAETKIVQTTKALVTEHVQSKEFQEKIVSEYQGRLANLEKRYAALSEELQRKEIALATLSGIPIKIDGSNVEFMNPKGQRFKILTGIVQSGEDVRFKEKYLAAPVVVAVIDSEAKAMVGLVHKGSIGDAFSIEASPEGFTLPRNTMERYRYRWIAIGE